METVKIVGILIGLVLIMLGVIAIYDARKLTEKFFSFYDKNTGVKWLKIGGFCISIIGALVLFFVNMK